MEAAARRAGEVWNWVLLGGLGFAMTTTGWVVGELGRGGEG